MTGIVSVEVISNDNAQGAPWSSPLQMEVSMVFGMLALTVGAIFAGAAFYVCFAEHPARSALDDRGQLTQWKPSYQRGALMQASLAVIGFLLGLAAWWRTGE